MPRKNSSRRREFRSATARRRRSAAERGANEVGRAGGVGFFWSFDFIVALLPQKTWQGGQDSNLQPTVLETATLPIELPPYDLIGNRRLAVLRTNSQPLRPLRPIAPRPAAIRRSNRPPERHREPRAALQGDVLLGFAVGAVAAAEAAIFAELEPVRRFLLVLLRVVIAALALGARHHNHHAIFFLCHINLPRHMK